MTTLFPRLMVVTMLCMCVALGASVGCFRSSSIKGMKCNTDLDCLHLRCIQGHCGGPDETLSSKDASEPALPETTNEAALELGPENDPNLGQRTLHQVCQWWESAPAERRCAPGFVCVRSSNLDASCLQDCSNDFQTCATNKDKRTSCEQVGWTRTKPFAPLMACVSVKKESEECDLGRSSICKRGSFNHLICIKGVCQPGALSKTVGSPCGLGKTPPAECDLLARLACSAEENDTCRKAVQSLEGESCSGGGDYVCAPGYRCISLFANVLGSCLKLCDTTRPDDLACPNRPGFTCADLGGPDKEGVCIQDKCQTYHSCSFKEPLHQCYQLQQNLKIVCLPNPGGTRELGQTCGPLDDPKNYCKAPHRCTGFDDGTTPNMCMPPCRFDNDCKPFPGNMTCVLSIQRCAWICKEDSDCPDGRKCLTKYKMCGAKAP